MEQEDVLKRLKKTRSDIIRKWLTDAGDDVEEVQALTRNELIERVLKVKLVKIELDLPETAKLEAKPAVEDTSTEALKIQLEILKMKMEDLS